MISKNQSAPVDERTWKESEDILCAVFCHALEITKGEFYYMLRNLKSHYRSKTETSRSGKQRTFYKASPRLKSLQNIIKRWLQHLPTHDAAHGWCKGRSPKTAAILHTGKLCVVKMDIADFYPSISHHQVYDTYIHLGCVSDVARILTKLTTWEGHLAQGLTTSPALANQVIFRIDARIKALCDQWNFTYTRYGDDITVSGGHITEPVVRGIKKILSQAGFETREEKYARQTHHMRQSVVGVVVNEVPNIVKEKRRLYRAMAHNCSTRGYESEQREGEEISTTKARIKGCISSWAFLNYRAALSSVRKLEQPYNRKEYWNENADCNCNGVVDVLDLDLLLRNFDQTGDA